MSNTQQNPPYKSIDNQTNLFPLKIKDENSSIKPFNSKQNLFRSDYSNGK